MSCIHAYNHTTIHTLHALSPLRHKSTDKEWVGAGVPHGNRKLDYTRDREWEPNPYVQPGHHTFRDFKYKDEQTRRVHGDQGFRHGASPVGDVFEKDIKPIARNFTYEADRKLYNMLLPFRAKHPKPFLGNSTAKGLDPNSFLSGHLPHPYIYNPYDAYEKTNAMMASNDHSLGNGFRPAR